MAVLGGFVVQASQDHHLPFQPFELVHRRAQDPAGRRIERLDQREFRVGGQPRERAVFPAGEGQHGDVLRRDPVLPGEAAQQIQNPGAKILSA